MFRPNTKRMSILVVFFDESCLVYIEQTQKMPHSIGQNLQMLYKLILLLRHIFSEDRAKELQ